MNRLLLLGIILLSTTINSNAIIVNMEVSPKVQTKKLTQQEVKTIDQIREEYKQQMILQNVLIDEEAKRVERDNINMKNKLRGTRLADTGDRPTWKEVDLNNLRTKSGLTVEQMNNLLQNTGIKGLGKAFIEAEEKYEVNAVFLAALGCHESGNGTSRIYKDKKNMFGYKAYDSCPYECAETFKDPSEGIEIVAKHLDNNYLKKGAKYFNGFSVDAVHVRYATGKGWANGIQKWVEVILK